MGVAIAFPRAVDLLAQAIEHVRRHLDRSRPVRERVRMWWAGVAAAHDLAAYDVVEDEFLQIARDSGLIADLGRHGDEDLRHVLRWGLLERNPFGRE